MKKLSMLSKLFVVIILLEFMSSHNTYSQLTRGVSPDNGLIIQHTRYRINYNCQQNIPYWCFEYITKESLKSGSKRNQRFEPDYLCKCTQSNNTEYSFNKTFDRGHLVPCDDFAYDRNLMNETFLYTNCVPQQLDFNRGTWQSLENHVRQALNLYDTIYVVTGVIVQNNYQMNGVIIPDYMYKVILYCKNGKYLGTKCYVMPNLKSTTLSKNIENFKISLSDLQKKTNLIFYSGVSSQILNTETNY